MSDSGLSDALQTLIRSGRLRFERMAAVQPGAGYVPLRACLVFLDELAAICTRVTASPQPTEQPQPVFTCWDCGAKGVPPKCEHFMQPWTLGEIAEAHKKLLVLREETNDELKARIVAALRQAIDEKLLVYGDGLIDKGALYREVLNDVPVWTQEEIDAIKVRAAERAKKFGIDVSGPREEPSAVVESCGIAEQEPEE